MSFAQTKVRTAARSAWGPVNSCRRILPGVWEVDTWGHGGYLVAVPDFNLSPMLRCPKFRGDAWTRGGIPVVEFYQFEEDCDWAVLMHYHPEVGEAVKRRSTDPRYHEQYEPDRIRAVVERWNPVFVRRTA
jgi:hypothetical protein